MKVAWMVIFALVCVCISLRLHWWVWVCVGRCGWVVGMFASKIGLSRDTVFINASTPTIGILYYSHRPLSVCMWIHSWIVSVSACWRLHCMAYRQRERNTQYTPCLSSTPNYWLSTRSKLLSIVHMLSWYHGMRVRLQVRCCSNVITGLLL